MKKILYLIIILATFSCGKDFLENEPAIIQLTDEALASPEGLENSVFALYDFPRIALRHRVYCYYFIAGTHLVKAGGLLTEDWGMSLYNSDLNSTHKPGEDYWNNSYKALNQANAIIGRAEKVGFTDEKTKNRLIAEARFFRAYILFYLEQRWENIPLLTEEVTVPVNNYKPASKDDIYKVITDDLIFAANTLEPKYNEKGRITKGAAQHLLAKVYMVMKNWSLAAEIAKNVINSGNYSLLTDRSQMWADNSQNNNEAIYVIQFAKDPTDEKGHELAQQFTPLIDRIKGVVRSFSQGGRPWARYYPSEYLLGLFETNDKRFETDYKTTWVYDNPDTTVLPYTFKYKKGDDSISVTVHYGDTIKQEYISNPTYYGPACKKYWEYGGHGRSLAETSSRKSIIRYRLAETYLIAAEALWRDGKTDEALTMINEVRKRAGVDPFTELNEDMILEEICRELAFEQEDWFTLKRMGRLVSMVKAFSPDKDITAIDDHHVRMPIPQSFIDATPGYPQNADY